MCDRLLSRRKATWKIYIFQKDCQREDRKNITLFLQRDKFEQILLKCTLVIKFAQGWYGCCLRYAAIFKLKEHWLELSILISLFCFRSCCESTDQYARFPWSRPNEVQDMLDVELQQFVHSCFSFVLCISEANTQYLNMKIKFSLKRKKTIHNSFIHYKSVGGYIFSILHQICLPLSTLWTVFQVK